MLHEMTRNNDFERNTVQQCWNNVAMLCCTKNRDCKSSCVTSLSLCITLQQTDYGNQTFCDIADSIKVALGFGNWALGIYYFVVTQANYCIVLQANAKCPIANNQLPKHSLLNQVYSKDSNPPDLIRSLPMSCYPLSQ